jgi:hypothetical protein
MFLTKKRALITLTFLILISYCLSALPSIGDFLSEEEITLLKEEGEITLFQYKETEPQLIPEVSQTSSLKADLTDLGGNFSIEGLFFIPVEEVIKEDSLILNSLNILSSVSTLEGLQYYSASRGEIRLLFEECWRIKDENSEEPIGDLHFSSLPEKASFFIHQKDLTFGSNSSAVTIITEDDCLFMSMKNLTKMRYNGVVKVINKGDFYTGVLVIPVEEGILYYGTMTAQTMNIGILMDKASKSFYNRMKALFNWFSAAYNS